MAVPPESVLFDIATSTRSTFERVLGTGVGSDVIRLSEVGMRPLAIAAHQLQAAHVGAQLESVACDPDMEPALRVIATDYGSASQAALNLAVRCSVTAVDLCAATLGRLCGHWPNRHGKEADTGTLKTRPQDFRSADVAVGSAVAVLSAAIRQPDWADIIEMRDRLTHRNVVQGVTGYIGPPPDPPVLARHHGTAELGGTQVLLDNLTSNVVSAAESIFRRVCTALT